MSSWVVIALLLCKDQTLYVQFPKQPFKFQTYAIVRMLDTGMTCRLVDYQILGEK